MKKRLALSLVTLAGVGVLLGSATREARSQDGAEPAHCAEMTPARLLQDPQIADELHRDLGRGKPAAEARFQAMVAEMRAVHGCPALDATEAGSGEGLRTAPGLPPGHPPIPRTPGMPVFADDAKIISI